VRVQFLNFMQLLRDLFLTHTLLNSGDRFVYDFAGEVTQIGNLEVQINVIALELRYLQSIVDQFFKETEANPGYKLNIDLAAQTITKPVTLRASRGWVTIGAPQ